MKVESFQSSEDGSLTKEMTSSFEKDGFLILENYVEPIKCDELIQQMSKLIDEFDTEFVSTVFKTDDQSHAQDDYFKGSGDKIRFFFESGALDESGNLVVNKHDAFNKVGHALHELDPVFSKFSFDRKLEKTAIDLGISTPVLAQSMYIFKSPQIGGEVDCHQDSTFLHTKPLSCIGFWFALEDADETNGGLFGIPGGHIGPLRNRFHYNDDGNLIMECLDKTPFAEESKHAPLIAPKGTLVLLHGKLPHRSAPNLSNRSRHAYTIHMVDGNAKWSSDNWLKRENGNPMRGFA